MLNLALTFMPDEMLPLVIVVIGLGVVLGFRQLAGWIPSILLSVLLTPLIVGVMNSLPPFVSVLVFAGFVLWTIRVVANFVLGRSATDHMVGRVAAGLLLAPLKLVIRLPFLLLRALFSALFPRRHSHGGQR
jgi:hypothetical protein